MRSTNDATSSGCPTKAARTTSAITGWSASRSGRMTTPSATGGDGNQGTPFAPPATRPHRTLGTVLGRGDAPRPLLGAGLIPTMATPGWERFEGFLWKTTSLLVLAQGQSLVVDPAISESEVARIGRRALELGAPVRHVLITHGDWDHVCGVGGFPDAVVVMGEETAEKVENGAADQSVRRAAEAYGFAFSGPPRVDETFSRGSALALGPFVVETFPLLGHTADGSGFRLRELGILLVGDYLSAEEFPFATSPAAYRMTLAGLIAVLRDDPPETVIPGHGPPLEPEDALNVAEADLRYLRSLHAAVVDALNSGRARDGARAAGLAVDLPRACPPDLEPMRGFNVDRQIEEILPAP
jgi:hydroxyacylglutathione hydrolase